MAPPEANRGQILAITRGEPEVRVMGIPLGAPVVPEER